MRWFSSCSARNLMSALASKVRSSRMGNVIIMIYHVTCRKLTKNVTTRPFSPFKLILVGNNVSWSLDQQARVNRPFARRSSNTAWLRNAQSISWISTQPQWISPSSHTLISKIWFHSKTSCRNSASVQTGGWFTVSSISWTIGIGSRTRWVILNKIICLSIVLVSL